MTTGSTVLDPQPAAPFAADLAPHRSATPASVAILTAAIGSASVAIGLGFFLAGAWPVLGFLGLDVLLVYVALRWNLRVAERRERVEIIGDRLIVTRYARGQDGEIHTFQAYWVRVVVTGTGPTYRVALSSHGRSLEIGAFLPATEREVLAAALTEALRRHRAAA